MELTKVPDGGEERELSAADIDTADDLGLLPVYVPEWKGKVYLRVLPADVGFKILAGMDKLRRLQEPERSEHMTEALRLVLPVCLVDKKGARLYTTPEQVEMLLLRNHQVLLRLQQTALELQGWGNEAAPKNGSSGTAPAAPPID
jgi:hypothetical protein